MVEFLVMKKFIHFISIPLLLLLGVCTHAQDTRARLVVAQDGTGDYRTIQEAVNAVRDFTYFRVTIFIRKGVYHEKLRIPSWKCSITLQGEDRDSTVITNSDYWGKPYPGKDASGRDKFGTFTSYTVLVAGDDIIAENLTFENAAGPVGQAVALHVEGDSCIFRNCRLLGNQDTLYAGGPAAGSTIEIVISLVRQISFLVQRRRGSKAVLSTVKKILLLRPLLQRSGSHMALYSVIVY
jgi:pectinesterase